MKIFITGGTGFIGQHLVKELAKENHQIYYLTRRQSGNETFNYKNVIPVPGILNDIKTYQNIFEKNFDVVYHLAAIAGQKWGISEEDYQKINVEVTENLLKACYDKIKRFIFCSSINALSDNNFLWDPYGKSKYQAEQMVKYYGKLGLTTVIIRPAIVYGPGDTRGMMLKMLKLIKEKKYRLIGQGNNLAPFVYIDDLVKAFVRALTCPDNTTYEIIGPGKTSFKEVLETAANLLNIKKPKKSVPVWLAKLTAQISELTASLFNIEPLITKHRVDFLIKERNFPQEKVRRELNLTPQITFSDGLAKTIHWYKENNYL